MLSHAIRLFPLWAILLSLLAWLAPDLFTPFKPGILPLLALIMFCMGLNLRLEDFSRVFRSPGPIGLGLFLQYSIMPAAAYFISQLLKLDPLLATGMILVGASPGGTASNVICYLAKANLALSITLTSLSTLLAIVMTPWLSWAYIDASIHVPAIEMLKSILMLVIAPVALGVIINQYLHRVIKPIAPLLPLIAIISIVMIIAIVVAMNHQRVGQLSSLLLVAIALHNLSGLVCGYLAGKLFLQSEQNCRTLAIETGMQNSGLAVALALKYFSASAALPGAIFSIWHNLSGSLIASIWRKR